MDEVHAGRTERPASIRDRTSPSPAEGVRKAPSRVLWQGRYVYSWRCRE